MTGLPSLWISVKIAIVYTVQHVKIDSTGPPTYNLVQRLLVLDIANVRREQGCVQDRTGITPCASCTSAKIRTLERTVQADALVRARKACTGPTRYQCEDTQTCQTCRTCRTCRACRNQLAKDTSSDRYPGKGPNEDYTRYV